MAVPKKPAYASPHWARQQTAKEAAAIAVTEVSQQGLSDGALLKWVKDGQELKQLTESPGWAIIERMADSIMDIGNVLALCDKGDTPNLAAAGAKAAGVRQLLLAVYQGVQMSDQAQAELKRRQEAKTTVPSKPRRNSPRATRRSVR